MIENSYYRKIQFYFILNIYINKCIKYLEKKLKVYLVSNLYYHQEPSLQLRLDSNSNCNNNSRT